jgi:hypothetical protein
MMRQRINIRYHRIVWKSHEYQYSDLGMTCETSLPSDIGGLRPLFGLNWQAPGSVS